MTVASPSDNTPERLQADSDALGWVVLLTSGSSTADDHARFRLWRDASPLHADALARARRLWSQLEIALPEIEHAAEGSSDVEQEREFARHRSRFTAGSRAFYAMAAVLLLSLGLGYQYVHVWRFDQVTATAERRSLVLGDGTTVTLAADSALKEDFTARERRVQIARGEAFFHVGHDARPFVVEARGAEIRDIGTAFDVALKPEATSVVVSQGIVEASNRGRRVRLVANQSADILPDGITPAATVDAHLETAWMRGFYFATNKPLSEVVAAISPYSARKIVLLGNGIRNKRVSAAVNLNNVADWVASLNETKDIRVTTLPGLVIIR